MNLDASDRNDGSTPSSSSQLLVLVISVCLALVLAACGGGDTSSPGAQVDSSVEVQSGDESVGGDDNQAADAGDDSADDDMTSMGGASSTSSDEADGPAPTTIEGYLGNSARFVRGGGFGGGGAGIDVDTLSQESQLIEQAVQACMQVQGFTYVPEADLNGGLQFFLSRDQGSTSAAEYAATEGFGITTSFDEIFEGEVELVDEDDPNDAHLETLSEGERDAWQFALRGAPPERNEQGQLIDPETGEVIQGGRFRARGGCSGEAQTEVRGDVSKLTDLAQDFEALEERIDADPRITELRREWNDCMLEAGFDYEDADEARADFRQQVRPLMVSFFQGSSLAGTGAGGRGVLGALQALVDTGLTEEQEAQLQQLQDLEVLTAVASVNCAGESPAEIEEITARYEAEFVEANRAALEGFGN